MKKSKAAIRPKMKEQREHKKKYAKTWIEVNFLPEIRLNSRIEEEVIVAVCGLPDLFII